MKKIKVYESFEVVNEALKINDEVKEKLAKKAIMMLSKVKGAGTVVKFEDAKGAKWELGVVASLPHKDSKADAAADYHLEMEYVNKEGNMSGIMSMGTTFGLSGIKKLKNEVIVFSISQL